MLITLIHTAAVWFMTGSIWTMQILNYPLLKLISPDSFAAYETAHNRRFLTVVGPGVGLTILATIALLLAKPPTLPWLEPILAAALLTAIIVLTARYQAPAHTRLARGFDYTTHTSLVRTNWIRTTIWTLLGLLDLLMLTQQIP